IRELDRPTLCLRQGFQRFTDGVVLDVALGGGGGVLVCGLHLRSLERGGTEGRLSPQDVDRTFMDDRNEPGAGVPALAPIGRGADPRYPLGPPLMLSPVALPGTGALDGISDPFPLADPSGRGEIYGPSSRRATDLSTKSRPPRSMLSTTSVVFQQCINSRPWFL